MGRVTVGTLGPFFSSFTFSHTPSTTISVVRRRCWLFMSMAVGSTFSGLLYIHLSNGVSVGGPRCTTTIEERKGGLEGWEGDVPRDVEGAGLGARRGYASGKRRLGMELASFFFVCFCVCWRVCVLLRSDTRREVLEVVYGEGVFARGGVPGYNGYLFVRLVLLYVMGYVCVELTSGRGAPNERTRLCS